MEETYEIDGETRLELERIMKEHAEHMEKNEQERLKEFPSVLYYNDKYDIVATYYRRKGIVDGKMRELYEGDASVRGAVPRYTIVQSEKIVECPNCHKKIDLRVVEVFRGEDRPMMLLSEERTCSTCINNDAWSTICLFFADNKVVGEHEEARLVKKIFGDPEKVDRWVSALVEPYMKEHRMRLARLYSE
jgi:hypothetical protein